MDFNNLKQEINKRMDGSLSSLQHSLNGLRTSRASISLLDPIKAEMYGSLMPLNQLGNISAPEAKLLVIQLYDKSAAPHVEKAIRNSGLGLNPIADGNLIRIPLPDLSAERRNELAKKAREYAEQTKIAIRNIRRDANDNIKAAHKNNEISEDEMKNYLDEVQKSTDLHIKKTDDLTETKAAEIIKI